MQEILPPVVEINFTTAGRLLRVIANMFVDGGDAEARDQARAYPHVATIIVGCSIAGYGIAALFFTRRG